MFNYAPYHSPFTNSIAETMLRKGDAAAHASEQTGQIYGQAIANVGQAVNGAVQQATDPQRQMARQQVSDLSALDKAFNQPGGRDVILASLPGHLRGQVAASFASADENAAKVQEANFSLEKATTEYVTGLAEKIKAHGYEPVAAQLALSHARQTFQSNPSLVQQVSQLEAQIQQPGASPDTIKALIDPIIAAKDAQEKPVILPSTPRGGAPAQLIKPGSGAVVATGAAAQAAAPTQAELAVKAAGGDPVAQAAMDRLKPAPVDSSQIKDVLLDGKPAQVLVDPKKPGVVTDLSGTPIADPALHIKPMPPASVQVNNANKAGAPGDFSKSGEDFLASIPVQWRRTVQKIAHYDEDPTKVASMRGGNREMLMQWVNQVNPGYDASQFTNRAPTRKAYTTGTQGQQITAINTAIGHLDQLAPLVADLNNGSFTPGNKVLNTLSSIFGSAKVTNFETLKDALAGEVASVLSKGAATVSGIAAEKEKIQAASSPAQLAGYVKTLIPLMGSKLASLDYQYHQAMGDEDSFSALSPTSKSVLAKYGFDPAQHTGAGSAGVSVMSPSGKSYPFPDQASADRFVADAKAKGLWK